MELELRKNTFVCYETVLDACVNHEETSDVIVPDASPDILRILGAFGNASVKDEVVNEGKYTLSGALLGWVLYVSEGDLSVRKLEVNIPFVHTFEHSDITSEQIGAFELRIAGLEAREINPRKVTVRANIAICAKTYRETTLKFPECVGDEGVGIECKTERVTPFVPIAIKKKNIHIGEDIELSAAMPEFSSVLRYDVLPKTVDTKTIGTKAVVKGAACLTCVYLTKDGEIARFTREIPFSQILEIDELHDDCQAEIRLHTGEVKLEPQYDMSGDVHYLALSLPIRVCAIVWTEREFEVIDDLYSIHNGLNVQHEMQKMTACAARQQKSVTVIESIPCEMQADKILDVSVYMEPTRNRREEGECALVNRLQVSVIYMAKDGSLCNAMRRVDAVCPISERGHEYRAASSLGEVNCVIEPMNEISVKICVDYSIDELERSEISVPSHIELLNDANQAKDGPSVVVRMIQSGETLWKLAKEYRTTVEDIMIANSLENDELIAGDMILIPKKR